jgi:transcriptional regulator with XRE-family HTH domain
MTYLAKNIRYLRKSRNWSQEELAQRLSLKRSSIAAYESKNVEPKLKVVLHLSKLFNIAIADLINMDLSLDINSASPYNSPFSTSDYSANDANEKILAFIETTRNTQKMLDGLKAFYAFKASRNKEDSSISTEADNLIALLEHLLESNESVIRLLNKKENFLHKIA